jgi:bifunctional UDP-N-acetylglucosamine pyrophosphorylase/glucosamine-1-phosphate N-acetyltransferase
VTPNRPAAVIILAAGGGTRMRSSTPKVLHRIGGRSLVGHAVAAARGLRPDRVVVVVRHDRDRVAAHVGQLDPQAIVADQDEIAGTARAAECGLEALPADLGGTVIITMADTPLLTSATLQELSDHHREDGSQVTVLTASLANPAGYGRILRDSEGRLVGMVEDADATDAQRRLSEVNCGMYAFDADTLRKALLEVGANNAQGERYLPDVIGVVLAGGGTVRTHAVRDTWQAEGVNDRAQLARLGTELNRRTVEHWMRAGVTIVDPPNTRIDVGVLLGPGVRVGPFATLRSGPDVPAGEGDEPAKDHP